jgi:hypothetical protein
MKETTEVFKYISFIENYLKGDLESFHKLCEKIEEEENSNVNPISPIQPTGVSGFGGFPVEEITPYYRSTTPHTLLLFSTIDIFGYLIRPNGNERETTKNFEEFFNGTISESFLDFLIVVVRHGVTHSFFPKLDVKISYHSSNEGKDLFFKDNENCIVINVNTLEKLVINKVDFILEHGDYSNMEIQFNKMISKYEVGVRHKINQLRDSLDQIY